MANGDSQCSALKRKQMQARLDFRGSDALQITVITVKKMALSTPPFASYILITY